MSLIATIDEFKLKYDVNDFILDNKLSTEVLEYYINNYEVDWYYITIYQTLSESFIEQYIDKLDWWAISMYQTISEQFIDKYSDRVYWNYISAHQTISESFIEKYNDKLDWYSLFTNKKITMCYEFILKHLYEFNLYRVSITGKMNEPIKKLTNEFQEKYNLDKIAYEFNNNS